MSIFLAVIGWICVIYFLCIALFVRHGTFFLAVSWSYGTGIILLYEERNLAGTCAVTCAQKLLVRGNDWSAFLSDCGRIYPERIWNVRLRSGEVSGGSRCADEA